MTLRKIVPTLIGLATILASQQAVAGPWTKDSGQYYAKVGQSVYLGSGEVAGSENYVGHTTSLYGEFGVAKRLQLNASLPFTVASQAGSDGQRRSTVGLADAELGLQWSPFDIPFALGASTSVPLYTLSGADELAPTLGDGQMDQKLTAGYGLALPALRGFASAEIGYQHRSNVYLGPRIADAPNFGDGFIWSAQIGRTFFNRPIVSLSANGVLPFRSDDVTKGYVSTGLSAYVPVSKHVAVEAGAFATPWARNSSRGGTLTVGVSFRD